MIHPFKSRSATQLINAVIDRIENYELRGMQISDAHGTNEFNFTDLDRSLLPSLLHKYAKNEHVGFIENFNKTVKECGRAIINGLPHKRYPTLMIISLSEHVANVINNFPSKESVPDEMIPSLIVEGK